MRRVGLIINGLKGIFKENYHGILLERFKDKMIKLV